MTLGQREIEAVTQEMQRELGGAVLVGAGQIDRYRVLLDFEATSGHKRVFVCTEVHLARLHFTEGSFRVTRPGELVGRLHDLEGARVVGLSVLYDDRVVNFSLSHHGRGFNVLFECSGHHPNLYLLDEKRNILAYLNPPTSRKRRLSKGYPYQKPLPYEPSSIAELRFLDQGTGICPLIEQWYHKEEERQARIRKVALVRRQLKAAISRLIRLESDLRQDLERQRHARRLLADPNVQPEKVTRLKRLARAHPATRARHATVARQVDRLKRILAELSYEGLDAARRAVADALARCAPVQRRDQ